MKEITWYKDFLKYSNAIPIYNYNCTYFNNNDKSDIKEQGNTAIDFESSYTRKEYFF